MVTNDPTDTPRPDTVHQVDTAADRPGRAVLAEGAELAGRFRVRRVIGRGGFGITYEGFDARLDRVIALKELFPPGAVREGGAVVVDPDLHGEFVEARRRLLREARSLARFTDPGIVGVYEMFEERGTAYLVLEHLTGPSLADVMSQRRRPLSEADVLAVIHRVGRALGVVHEAGLLHRDVSPSNLIVGPHSRVVLIDFGLAQVFTPDRTAAMTRIVTPGYAPPEQYAGTDRFGPPSDIYSLAATAFRLLTARIPATAIERQAGRELASVRHLAPEVSRLVADAVADGLELDRDHRPQTAAAFLARCGLDPDAEPGPLSDEVASARAPAVMAPEPAGGGVWAGAAAGAAAGALGAAAAGATGLHDGGVHDAEVDGEVDGDDATLANSPGDPGIGAPGSVAGGDDPDGSEAWSEWQTGTGGSVDAEASALWHPEELATEAPADPATAVAPAPPDGGQRTVVTLRPDPRRSLGAPGRWRTTLPITVAVLAVASALPVALVPVLVVIVLPAIATIGDLTVQAWLAETRQPATWSQRTPARTLLARPFANLARSLGRSLPGLVILALVIASWYPMRDSEGLADLADIYLRVGSLAGVAAVWLPTLGGSHFFHSGIAFDGIHRRLWPGGRWSSPSGLAVILLGIMVAVAGALFTADVWPLPT